MSDKYSESLQAVPERIMQHLTQAWGWVLLRGVVSILFGVMAIAWPQLAIVVLVALWGAFALVDGVFSLAAAGQACKAGRQVWPFVLGGILGVGFGVFALVWPQLTALGLLFVIAFWALVMGGLQLVTAFTMKSNGANGFWAFLSGILSVVFGLAVLLYPISGALAVIWVIGFYAIVFGVLLVILALHLSKLNTLQA